MHSFWLKAIVILAVIWLSAGGIIYWTRNAKPTPESLDRYLARHPIAEASSSQRAKILEKVSGQLNQFAYEERREFRGGKRLEEFFRALTPEEQSRFLDLTLPTGFKQMMEAFNKMEPKKRKEFVGRALRDMQEQEGEPPPAIEDPNLQKIINQGLKSFYTEASGEVKLDFAPLIEQMQQNLQGR
ncbi:MAG: hypothetical protein M3463_10160 [Verrucomicrobiota bacterium]|nr:hypothetical protein [Verrucomicrobiota bacterium]